ncbi:MAG: aldo/keto reductase [Eubacteriales bacterium]|nr:aldo/keto reductase [Eubacteriales bacterium]
MEYREMEKLGVKPSLLGFGCMRFPTREDKSIDEEKSQALLDKAINNGLTYIDTAYPYHEKSSEEFLGRALSKYNRESYYLATKLPVWLVEEPSDVRKYFEEQCKNLNTDYIDFYLFHALGRDRWDSVKKHQMIEAVEKLRDEGKIRFIGFSFHDEYPVFEEILTYREWDFCQIQLNYVDTNIQQGMKGYELADRLGIPVIIMEPAKGGALAKLPEKMESIFYEIDKERSVASWAFRYIATLPNVKVVLSGMSDMQQVEDNLKTFNDFEPLNPSEMEAIQKVTQIYRSRQMNDCTGCNYCMPCPFGVNIPGNFGIWNQGSIYEDLERAKEKYHRLDEGKRATACQECGACESQCPQSIPIINDLKRVALQFE